MQKQLKQIIASDPKVMMGKPVIAGTRITVELIMVLDITNVNLTSFSGLILYIRHSLLL
ncbi:DUF433 domain-containing protein [Dolichospermum flos-aquae]|jgi:hypothetical protein|uniref:DUF433 domain-containing protein n=1 Tax=Dolichospermum flos-aquae CCAP 1403/13F TaxID=315271 RepID=A0A6H2C0S7_DOLFA|nr:DUF433 domain-containing protein [Dolichospermum flos-aquae CCAP 1403/13F]